MPGIAVHRLPSASATTCARGRCCCTRRAFVLLLATNVPLLAAGGSVLSLGRRLAFWQLAQADADSATLTRDKTFNVSNIGKNNAEETREELFKIFDAISVRYGLNLQNKIIPVTVPASFTVLRGKVLSQPKPNGILLTKDGDNQIVHLDLATPRALNAGDPVTVTARNASTYLYATPQGAPIRIPNYYEAVLTFQPLTHERFLQELKSGRTFDVDVPESFECPTCHGLGWVYKKDAAGAESSLKVTCPTCQGAGKVDGTTHYTVAW